jgi:hypothetical protein
LARSPPVELCTRGERDQAFNERIPSGIGNEIRSQPVQVTAARKNLTFECRAEKIAIAPDQPTPAHGTEIVERNAEFGRNDVQAVQSEAGAMVGDIANTTCVDTVLASEEHQHVAIDRRAADGAALNVASGLVHFPKRRHARLPHEENKAAERRIIA